MLLPASLGGSLVAVARLLAAATASPLVPLDPRDVCPENPTVVEQLVIHNVVEYPVCMDQFFPVNTDLIIKGGITLTIKNAPTRLSTNVIATVTETSTRTENSTTRSTFSSSSSGAGITSLPDSFFLRATAGPVNSTFGNSSSLQARQEVSDRLLTSGGTTVSNCGVATHFTLANGQLSAGGLFSAATGAASARFAVIIPPGDITGTFSFAGGILAWSNAAFAGGAARFCRTPANDISAVFTGPLPSDCVAVTITLLAASQCPTATPSVTPSGSDGGPLSTVTTELPSGATGFTSTVPPSGTAPGSVVVGLPSGSAGTVTTTLPPGSTGFTSTIPASGTGSGSVIVGVPSGSTSSRSGTASTGPTSTPRTTVSTTISSGSVAFTTTITGPGPVETVEVVIPCVELGFQYEIYDNPFLRTSPTDPYANFDPAYFGMVDSFAVGNFTGSKDFFESTRLTSQVYNTPDVNLQQKAISAYGYIYSTVDQTVNINPSATDILFVWTGATAISGYDQTNRIALSLDGVSSTAGTINVRANTYTPIRWTWASAIAADAGLAVLNLALRSSVAPITLDAFVCPEDAPPFEPFVSGGGGTKLPGVTCNVRGFSYAICSNPYVRASPADQYDIFDPTTFAAQNPLATDTFDGSRDFSLPDPTPQTIYNTFSFPPNQLAINGQAYMYSPAAQTLTFPPAVDVDVLFAWTGPTAVSGYTTANRLLRSLAPSDPNGATTIQVPAHSFTALRWVWGSSTVAAATNQFQLSLPIQASVAPITTFSFVCDYIAPAFPFYQSVILTSASARAAALQNSTAAKPPTKRDARRFRGSV